MNEDDSADKEKLLMAVGILGDHSDQERVLRNLRDSIELSQRIPPAAVSITPIKQYSNLPSRPPRDFPPPPGITNNRGREAAPRPAQDFNYQSVVAHHPRIDFSPWQHFMTASLKHKARSRDPIAERLYRESIDLYSIYTLAREERDKITLESAIKAAMGEQVDDGHNLPTDAAHIKWTNYTARAFSNNDVEKLARAFQLHPDIGDSRNFLEKCRFLQRHLDNPSPNNWQYPNSWGIVLIDHLGTTNRRAFIQHH